MILPNDMVFVDILLNGLYEEPLVEEDRFCVVHPAKKQHMAYNGITDYCADMGMLLAYYKLLDDEYDEKKPLSASKARIVRHLAERINGKCDPSSPMATAKLYKSHHYQYIPEMLVEYVDGKV